MVSPRDQVDFLVNNPRLSEIMGEVRKHAAVLQTLNVETAEDGLNTLIKTASIVQEQANNIAEERTHANFERDRKTAELLCMYAIASKLQD